MSPEPGRFQATPTAWHVLSSRKQIQYPTVPTVWQSTEWSNSLFCFTILYDESRTSLRSRRGEQCRKIDAESDCGHFPRSDPARRSSPESCSSGLKVLPSKAMATSGCLLPGLSRFSTVILSVENSRETCKSRAGSRLLSRQKVPRDARGNVDTLLPITGQPTTTNRPPLPSNPRLPIRTSASNYSAVFFCNVLFVYSISKSSSDACLHYRDFRSINHAYRDHLQHQSTVAWFMHLTRTRMAPWDLSFL